MNSVVPNHILMTADPIGGVWPYALELAGVLARHGINVTLAVMGAPLRHEQREEVKALPQTRVFESDFKLEWMDSPWQDVSLAGEWLLSLEEQLRPDLIHLNGYSHAVLPWKAPKIVVAHSCVLSWWRAVKHEPAPSHWWHYREFVKNGLRAADLTIAPTNAMLRELDCFYGPTVGTVIPNGRCPSFFKPGRKEPIILSAGRLWDEAKNTEALARVGHAIRWPIYVAGDRMHPGGKVVDYTNVEFLGRLAPRSLASWYARASIYALPARYEPFGLSILEAALSGCALVLGNIPSLRETWSGAARFVDPDNTDALRDCLDKLTGDPAAVQELGDRARRRAVELTPEKMGAGYMAAYQAASATHANRKMTTEGPCAL